MTRPRNTQNAIKKANANWLKKKTNKVPSNHPWHNMCMSKPIKEKHPDGGMDSENNIFERD